MGLAMRILASLVFGLAALLFGFLVMTVPWHLRDQAAKDREYFRQFVVIEGYVANRLKATNRLPDDQELRNWAANNGFDELSWSVSTTPPGCEPTLELAPGDRFQLSFWRGEWSECFASPSHKTTLVLTWGAYLRDFAGAMVVYAATFLLCAWAAWRLLSGRASAKSD